MTYHGQMSPANTTGLLDQGNLGETATQQFTRCGKACNARTNDADAMLRASCKGNTVYLLYQSAIVKA